MNTVLAEEVLAPGSKKETTEALFPPIVPHHVKSFFDFLCHHVQLEGVGMGGVKLRESKYELSQLLSTHGYEYELYGGLARHFENEVLKQYYDSQEKK